MFLYKWISLKEQRIRRDATVIGYIVLPELQLVEKGCILRQGAKGSIVGKVPAGQRVLPRRDPQLQRLRVSRVFFVVDRGPHNLEREELAGLHGLDDEQ